VSALEFSAELPSRFAASRPASGGRGDSDPGDSDPIVIAELARAQVQVSARKNQCDALARALSRHLGVTLPGPGASQETPQATVLWLQPASWLIQSAPTLARSLLTDFARAHPGLASWVDQTHSRCLLRLSGSAVRAVLARLCRLDLHPRAFAPGACAATLVGHVSAVLRRVPQSDVTGDVTNDSTFDLLVAASYADWLLDELTTAADAYGWRFLAHRPTQEP